MMYKDAMLICYLAEKIVIHSTNVATGTQKYFKVLVFHEEDITILRHPEHSTLVAL